VSLPPDEAPAEVAFPHAGPAEPQSRGDLGRAKHLLDEVHEKDDQPARSLPSLPTPTASAGQDVDQREEGDDDHRSDGHDRDCGSSEDHAPFLSRSSLLETCGRLVGFLGYRHQVAR
jgi:hypothetical protein